MTAVMAFRGDPRIKETCIEQVNARIEECHNTGAFCDIDLVEFGIPPWLNEAKSTLLKQMDQQAAEAWLNLFVRSIEPGADLEKIRAPIIIRAMQPMVGLYRDSFRSVRSYIEDCIALWRRGDQGSREWEEKRKCRIEDAWYIKKGINPDLRDDRLPWSKHAVIAMLASCDIAATSVGETIISSANALASRAFESSSCQSTSPLPWEVDSSGNAIAAAKAAKASACNRMADHILELLKGAR